MRFVGQITDWNDGRGFGFVSPIDGGARAFVHVKEFEHGSRRPVTGDLISYLLKQDHRGRLQAREVRHVGQKIESGRKAAGLPRAAIGLTGLALVVAAAVVGAVPVILAFAYLALSALSYLLYLFDKAFAEHGARRTPETTLHLADLLGGWPGALIAQQQFRHKTGKRSFQAAFWATVLFNVLAAGWFVSSGTAARLVPSLGG